MIEEMLREDILQVYVGKAQMSRKAQDVIISQADAKVKNVASKTPTEIIEMFSERCTGSRGAVVAPMLKRRVCEYTRQGEYVCCNPKH